MLSIGNQGSSLMERLGRDPAGNTLSVIVLAGMLVILVGTAAVFPRSVRGELPVWQDWLLPILALIGMSVAAYLSYIEITQVTAVCGPVGDCNTVNQSEYAFLFGVLPVGVLGISGYILILFAWLVRRLAPGRWGDLAALCLLGLTTFGLLFSIYLTFLEPFVIGATCAWCLTSALIMTALFWLSVRQGKEAWKRVKGLTIRA
jgi:uncharacterized membrane protein